MSVLKKRTITKLAALLALLLLIFNTARKTERGIMDPQVHLFLAPARDVELHPTELLDHLGLRPDAVVADIGAGPGFLTVPLARLVPLGRVIAIDTNADFLAITRSRAREAQLRNIETFLAKPDDPGTARSILDAVVLLQVDHILPNRVEYLVKLTQALKPTGRAVIVNFEIYHIDTLRAAQQAGLQIIDTWKPSSRFFAVLFEKAKVQKK